jgi:hypothetical protein
MMWCGADVGVWGGCNCPLYIGHISAWNTRFVKILHLAVSLTKKVWAEGRVSAQAACIGSGGELKEGVATCNCFQGVLSTHMSINAPALASIGHPTCL